MLPESYCVSYKGAKGIYKSDYTYRKKVIIPCNTTCELWACR